MKLNQKIKTIEMEHDICKRKLKEEMANYKAASRMSIRNHDAALTDMEYQLTLYYMHLSKLQDELIKLYWQKAFPA